MQHSLVPAGAVHAPHQWIFATQADRLAAVISDRNEINKLALQVSDGTYWRLTGFAPNTWAPVATATAPFALVYGEVPAGAIDGVNTVFTLAAAPDPAQSCQLFIQYVADGAWLRLMRNFDFTLAGGTITMNVAPNAGAHILVDYRKLP
jgi:hypothetical protein